MNAASVRLILEEHGFKCARHTKMHRVYRNQNGRVVIVPSGNALPSMALSPIIKASGLDPCLFSPK
jgi:predicted RNA binding protein YcfA (HicA-like mRNA interferase family)